MQKPKRFLEFHTLQLLRRIEHVAWPLDLLVSTYFQEHRALGAKDRQHIAEAVFGMARWRQLLDHLVGPTASWEERLARFHSINPQDYARNTSLPPAVRFSVPGPLFHHLERDYGQPQACALAALFNEQAPTTVRANLLKTTRAQLFDRWQHRFPVTLCTHSPWGLCFAQRTPLFTFPEFKEGLFEVQDEGSQLVAAQVAAKPGQKVLDFCAGSGGKTLAFAPAMQSKGQIFLHDIRPRALEQARLRLKRAGVFNAQIVLPDAPQLQTLQRRMDWVLIDVPCSGTGTLRRNPDQKGKFCEEALERLVAEQRSIFEKALLYVRPGGKIVYATCSLLKKENAEQVAYFLERYPISLDAPPLSLLPLSQGMDGFFAATFTTAN